MSLGGLLALVAGIWIGLGMPGIKRDAERGEPHRRSATLDRTWINRMMKNRLDTPRRFSSSNLIRPDAAEGTDDRGASDPLDSVGD